MNAIPSLRLATAFALLAVSKVFAADPTPAPKTHVLFMGADIDVERNGSFHRVRDVKGDAFVIDEGGENKKIHMSSGSVNLKVNEQLKLTSESVRIDKLQADRGYTLGADPFRRFV